MTTSVVEPCPDGFRIRVRLTPKAGKDALEGVGVDAAGVSHLKARVRAAPEDGKANAALEALLAKALKVPKSAVSVEKGATNRVKVVAVRGDAGVLAKALELIGRA